ncbi:MAG: DUF2399 domain-containing protein [Labedaea sp.]
MTSSRSVRTLLTLNLALTGSSPAARLCAAAPGEPVWLTLRSLSWDWAGSAGADVVVCENPTVVEAAADALAARCPPLICTDGIASGAAMDLIGGLARGCGPVRVRADVDPAGFTVVEQVLAVAPQARLWRFDAGVYAAAHGLPGPEEIPEEAGAALDQLRETYRGHQVPLHEERVLDGILFDLGQEGSLRGEIPEGSGTQS